MRRGRKQWAAAYNIASRAERGVTVTLKLYVWENFCPDYSDGLAFAIAENETEARALVEKEHDYPPWDWGPVKEYPIEKIAFFVHGGS